jgi:DNA polymerase/3'-5' exonuclease PolX
MLLYLTGSAEYSKKMRWIANQCKMVLSQYGLRDTNTKELVGEQIGRAIHEMLGMEWLEPEERECVTH